MELDSDVRRWAEVGRSRRPVGLGGRKVAPEKAKPVPANSEMRDKERRHFQRAILPFAIFWERNFMIGGKSDVVFSGSPRNKQTKKMVEQEGKGKYISNIYSYVE